jgi:hypothetical protein
MALSEYALIVSLSAGIAVHGNADPILVGHEALTQPDEGSARVAFTLIESPVKVPKVVPPNVKPPRSSSSASGGAGAGKKK